MTRIERRVLLNCVLAGTLLTGMVVMLELGGWLAAPENLMYDLRARHFQYFAPPPTDKLVHLDIDDKAIEGIGRWPWPRSTEAAMIDELHAAGAKAIGMDILFSDPQKPDYEPADDDSGKFTQIDHDANFVAAVKRAGNVLLPASISLAAPSTDPVYDAALAQLLTDIEMTDREVADRIRPQFPHDSTFEARLNDAYIPARRAAVDRRVEKELTAARLTPEALRQRLIKRRDASVNSPLSRMVDEERVRYEAIIKLMRFGIAAPKTADPFIPATVNLPILPALGDTVAATAFVDFSFTLSRDGVVRTQPLMVESRGRLFPQMGLSLALLYLGSTPDDVSFTEDSATIRCPDNRLIILPISHIYSETLGREVPAIFNVPWFGSKQWETMYDWPAHRQSAQHMSLNVVNDISMTRQRIARNNQSADRYLSYLSEYDRLDPVPPSSDPDPLVRLPLIEQALKAKEDWFAEASTYKEEDMAGTEDGRRFAAIKAWKAGHTDLAAVSKFENSEQKLIVALHTLQVVQAENPLFDQQLKAQRKALHDAVAGKAVLIGFTATGHQDAVPTPLHATCPGVVTHGAIFNAIITGRTWTVAPEWITIAFTIALGWVTAVIAWRFSPLGAFCITSVFGMAYVALNGLFFFDRHGQIVGLAAPQLAMAAVWSGCSLARIVIESSERHRIIRRFRSYVDPAVVNFMMERPDEVRMNGETRELTVCFSDIAGFTSLSEKLGEGIVPILNEFMDLMVPIIRNQHGTVDKFLGDGIMFFFGAPVPHSDHASDAVATALLMQQALGRFNEDLLQRGLPTVKVRIGINTGMMVVGDAGSTDAADYTVLGDNVNFASRLESANKQVGTSILLSARTAELAGDRFLLRPIGSLQVVGQTRGVPTFTVVGAADGADSKELTLCEKSKVLVAAFRGRDFAGALAITNEIEQTFGPSTLTKTYRELCEQYLVTPPDDAFDGTIVLAEK